MLAMVFLILYIRESNAAVNTCCNVGNSNRYVISDTISNTLDYSEKRHLPHVITSGAIRVLLTVAFTSLQSRIFVRYDLK